MIFRDSDCGTVPVVDEGKPVGILTDRDVALALPEYPDLAARPVGDLMTKDVVTVPADTPLPALREKFGAAKVRRLLVTDPDGGLRGIVAWSDLTARLPEQEIGRVVSEVVGRPGVGDASDVKNRTPTRPGAERQDDRAAAGSRWAWARPAAFWGLLRATASEWMEDKVPRLGAALAFYSVLSIAPAARHRHRDRGPGLRRGGRSRPACRPVARGGRAGRGECHPGDDQERQQARHGHARRPARGRHPALRRLGRVRPAPGRDEHHLGGPAQAGPGRPGDPQGPIPLLRHGARHRLPAAGLAGPQRGRWRRSSRSRAAWPPASGRCSRWRTSSSRSPSSPSSSR